MRIYLLTSPWAASAAHTINVGSGAQWRAAIASIAPARYCAAMLIPEIDPAKPFPVQRFRGTEWPVAVTSSDGFLVVRTGLSGCPCAADQWAVLSAFPAQIVAAETFMNSASRSILRQAVFPGPRLVNEDTKL